MKKRILSIICIMFLLFTISTPLTGSVFTYADEGLDDQQKAALAMSSYFNYRKGWYVGSTAGAITVMKSYVDDFFNDDANNTGINSYSEFSSHISVSKDDNNHWGVTIDNTGLVFLDHLVKWLLGKNKFPDLHSGGSWGSGPDTIDNLYDGYTVNGQIVWVIDESIGNRDNPSTLFDISYLSRAYNYGLAPDSYYNLIIENNPSWNRLHRNGNDNPYIMIGSYSVNFPADYTKSYGLIGTSRTENGNYYDNDYYPCITDYESGNSDLPGFLTRVMWCDNGLKTAKAYYGVVYHQYDNTYTFSKITIDYSSQKFVYKNFKRYYSSEYPQALNPQSASVNLNTNDFDKNDVGQADQNGDPVPDAPSKTFTPEYTTNEGDTYNYYTNETVNNFYNEYTNNYTYNTNNEYNNTVINYNTTPDDPDDPEDPDNPSGGTTPPWDGSNAGTLTPDGNGGYNFNLPDLTIPDLDINWSLSGLTEKFPFSIPWDLMAFFTVLNAEPETPSIQATIDLGIVDWDIDWDLHNFDTLAVILRNLEFIGFCLALILITRSIIKG